MSTAVSFNSIRVGVLGRQRALWCRLSGRNTRNAPPLKGLTGRYVSKWPAKASKPQENCSCMVSDTQDSPAVDERSLVLLNSINDSAKWVVTLTAGGVLLWHHNVDVSWSLLGSIVTVFVCKTLKQLINLQRPKFAKKTDPGMPSSHASSLAYLSVYMALAWHPEQYLLAGLGLLSSVFLIPLRVILGYHSVPQVLAGTLLGAASAASWLFLGQTACLPLLKANTSSQVPVALVVAAAVIGYLVLVFRNE